MLLRLRSYRVKRGTIPLIMTPNGPHNLLPAFSFQLHGGEAVAAQPLDNVRGVHAKG